MPKPTDVCVVGAQVHLLPVQTRVPLKFGPEVLTSVTCVRVALDVQDRTGRQAVGWGETPLSVQWVWPGALSYEVRQAALLDLIARLATAWCGFEYWGHPIEVWAAFETHALPEIHRAVNADRSLAEQIPWLAALLCCASFDIALHDAYGRLLDAPSFETYNGRYMSQDLSVLLADARGPVERLCGCYPEDYLVRPRRNTLDAWHLVGGLDPLDAQELSGDEPDDGHPLVLEDWIERDGLRCIKIKLRGTDAAWDYARVVRVGQIGLTHGVVWFSTDFNCTVSDPTYVTDILDRLLREEPEIYAHLLYVEQPFPYELLDHQIDVHNVSARKPLFMDESAHDWRLLPVGQRLGWTGVALKTCKTLSGALLSLAWAKAHGMTLMVQDLTNPMLAQIPHILLAAHAGTIMGVETNAMQYYPDASWAEAAMHPGLYVRRRGTVSLETVHGSGMGYRLEEMRRTLPDPVFSTGRVG